MAHNIDTVVEMAWYDQYMEQAKQGGAQDGHAGTFGVELRSLLPFSLQRCSEVPVSKRVFIDNCLHRPPERILMFADVFHMVVFLCCFFGVGRDTVTMADRNMNEACHCGWKARLWAC